MKNKMGADKEKQKMLESMTVQISGPKTPAPSASFLSPLTQSHLNVTSLYEQPKIDWLGSMKEKCSFKPKKCLLSTIPVLDWLPRYKWRQNFLYDVLSGCTVAIMHIPQGMAYGMLGNVPPVFGLYMAVFPVLIYFMLGTSKHISIGTFAIVCLMTGKAVASYSTHDVLGNGTLVTHGHVQSHSNTSAIYTNVEVATSITFLVSIMMIMMYILRLGIISNLLSQMFVNSFTCACAFHVVASQLKDLFGLPIEKRRGYFSFPYTIYDSALAVPNANWTAVIISTCMITMTVMNNELLKPFLAKKTKIPFPIELLAVVVGTSLSYFLNLNENYGINIVGNIPTGLPAISWPRFDLMTTVVVDALAITIVSYAISMSMSLIFAQKLHYDIDANQELFALSCANMVGSLFCCLPITASLSRSTIQQTVGGITQLASVVSCSLIVCIILWVGPIFEGLPRCVLASIIIVALKSLLLQSKMVVKFWKMSTWDGVIWLVTFLATAIVSIDVGLIAGLLVSLASLLYQGQVPYTCLLGLVPNTEWYLDVTRYKGAIELKDIKIFHYCGSINFATSPTFRKLLYDTISFNPTYLRPSREGEFNETMTMFYPRCVILDCSALTYVDPAGVNLLREIYRELQKGDIEFYIAACSAPVFETLKKCDEQLKVESPFYIFPRIHDAVSFAKITLFKRTSEMVEK